MLVMNAIAELLWKKTSGIYQIKYLRIDIYRYIDRFRYTMCSHSYSVSINIKFAVFVVKGEHSPSPVSVDKSQFINHSDPDGSWGGGGRGVYI